MDKTKHRLQTYVDVKQSLYGYWSNRYSGKWNHNYKIREEDKTFFLKYACTSLERVYSKAYTYRLQCCKGNAFVY